MFRLRVSERNSVFTTIKPVHPKAAPSFSLCNGGGARARRRVRAPGHLLRNEIFVRAVVQRVSSAEVRLDGQVIGRIGAGLLVLAGIGTGDTPETAKAFAGKILNLRILNGEDRKMNRCLLDVGGEVLCVSQFTLYGDARHGRRPSYTAAAAPIAAQPLYESLLNNLRALGEPRGIRVESGRFQAMMEVESVNDGPVTLLFDSDKTF